MGIDLEPPNARCLSIVWYVKEILHFCGHIKERALANIGVSNYHKLIIAALQLIASKLKVLRQVLVFLEFFKEGCYIGIDMLYVLLKSQLAGFMLDRES